VDAGLGFAAGLGAALRTGGGAALTTVGSLGSATDNPSTEAGNGDERCIGTVTSVPRASTRTAPLAADTSFGLMEIPLLADTHP
jgi:hypothetical protein